MLLTYYMWIKAVKTGSVYWSSVCALAYFYMVSGWKDASQDWLSELIVSFLCVGFLLGRLCVLDQPDPPPRSGFDADRTIFSPNLRGLLHSLLPGHHPFHADLFCWLPGKDRCCRSINVSIFWKTLPFEACLIFAKQGVPQHLLSLMQPVQSSEHMAAFGVFGLCQIHAFVDYLRSKLNAQQFEVLFKSVISLVGFILLSVGAVLMLTGEIL